MNTGELLPLLQALTAASEDTKIAATDEQFEPAFFAKPPPTIRYSPILLSDPDAKPQEITVTEFAAQHGFTWTDSQLISRKLRDKTVLDRKFSKFALSEIEQRCHHPFTAYTVVKINNQVGHGVFYTPNDKQVLPCGTLLALYTGHIKSGFQAERSHRIGIHCDEQQQTVVNHDLSLATSDAANAGNFTRFIQDMPSAHELVCVGQPELRNRIATANVLVLPAVYYGYPVALYITSRDILPGEQFGVDYEWSHEFWVKQGIKRAIFDHFGVVMGHFENSGSISFDPEYKLTKELTVPEINLAQLRRALLPLITNLHKNSFDHKAKFLANISFILEVYINRFNDKTGIVKDYLCALQNTVKNCSDKSMDEVYKAILAVDKPYTTIKEVTELKPFRRELIFHMTAYKEGSQSKITLSSTTQQSRSINPIADPKRVNNVSSSSINRRQP